MTPVIFDIDDTLYDLAGPYRAAWADVFQGRVDADADAAFMRSRVRSDEAYELVLAGKASMEDMYVMRVQAALADLGASATREEALAFQRAYEHHQRRIEVSPAVASLLDDLSAAGVSLGVLSNGDARHQREKAEFLGLERWFSPDRIVISGEVGAAKPERAIFDAARERLGIPDDVAPWFAGDTYETDIQGAISAGWRTIWYNHRRRALPVGAAAPDIEVATESELCAVVRELVG